LNAARAGKDGKAGQTFNARGGKEEKKRKKERENEEEVV
jgi:hypothetical protein